MKILRLRLPRLKLPLSEYIVITVFISKNR